MYIKILYIQRSIVMWKFLYKTVNGADQVGEGWVNRVAMEMANVAYDSL